MEVRRIHTICKEGKISGAVKFGMIWAIPANVDKPIDRKIKTGKYIKFDL